MTRHTVVTMPGDGIGRIVLPEAIRVLDAAGFDAQYIPADIGWDFWTSEGTALPQRTIDLLAEHRLGLFGAITSKPKREGAAELNPVLQGQGLTYRSPIVELRQRFQLDVCIRPCRSFPGNPLNFVRRGPEDRIEEPEIDVVIFRQGTEGLYAGVEWTDPPDEVRKALGGHPGFARFAAEPGSDLAVTTRIFTRNACRRIVRAAFQFAVDHGYASVTVCEKPNMLRETSGMMEEVAAEVHREYPGIDLRSTNIDAQMMWLTKDPERFDVVVSSNMFGDIVSDAFAGLVGGLGFAASGNVGDDVAVFEPTHGSAPRYADLDPSIVNPIAMILSAVMLVRHVGDADRAQRVEQAVAAVVASGQARSYDVLRLRGGPEAIAAGATPTSGVTDAVIEALG